MTIIKRVCGCCRETLCITKDNIGDAIYYDKKTYHSKCFTDICNRRAKMKNPKISSKWQGISDNLQSIQESSFTYFNESIIKDDLFNFLLSAYDITVIPSTVWQKLSSIYSGTYKGMSVSIPPEHLLDMWKRKMNKLNSIAAQNKLKGKTMDSAQRLNYDLSVLINKYDSYLKWLEKQKILATEQNLEEQDHIVAETISFTNTQNTDNTDTDDISSLVDDIFG